MPTPAIFTLAAATIPATGPRMIQIPPGADVEVAATGTAGTATGTGPSTTAGSQPAAAPKEPGFPGGIFLPIILMFVALYFVMNRGPRKEEKRRKELLANLKKGDRVMTIGGMMAKVVSVENDEVVLKVDEAANVKATYRKSAIQEVFVDKEEKK